METAPLIQVDAFAQEPLAGVPVAIVEEPLVDTQARRVGRELGVVATVRHDEDLRIVPVRENVGLEAAVATATGLSQRDRLEPGEHVLDGPGSRSQTVELAADGKARVSAPHQPVEETAGSIDRIAKSLGLDPAALEDIGADLPPAVVDVAGGTLSVGVNFFEHLSRATPGDQLPELCADLGVTRLCAVTFDTLERTTDAHVRVFEADGTERAVSAAAVAACGAHLGRHDVFDADTIAVESGHAVDRPSIVETDLTAQPSIAGRGLVVLEGTVSVPPTGDDEIIEL